MALHSTTEKKKSGRADLFVARPHNRICAPQELSTRRTMVIRSFMAQVPAAGWKTSLLNPPLPFPRARQTPLFNNAGDDLRPPLFSLVQYYSLYIFSPDEDDLPRRGRQGVGEQGVLRRVSPPGPHRVHAPPLRDINNEHYCETRDIGEGQVVPNMLLIIALQL